MPRRYSGSLIIRVDVLDGPSSEPARYRCRISQDGKLLSEQPVRGAATEWRASDNPGLVTEIARDALLFAAHDPEIESAERLDLSGAELDESGDIVVRARK